MDVARAFGCALQIDCRSSIFVSLKNDADRLVMWRRKRLASHLVGWF